MQTRLTRPLLAAVLTGAVLAGGAMFTGPALAAPPAAVASDEATTPVSAPDPTTGAPDTTPSGADPTTTAPAADPTTTAATVDPTTTAATVDPTTAPTTDPTTDPTTGPTAGPADTTAPTGSFRLNYSSLWVGQRTTLTVAGVADDHSAPDAITRVVSWGDGTSSALPATQDTITKQYTRSGTFPVTLTLTDAAGNAQVVKSGGVAVTVPGKFKLSTTSVWPGQVFTVGFASVPAGTTRIVLNYGDGYGIALKGKNQTVPGVYYHRYGGGLMPAGPVTLTAVFTNGLGSTTPITVGRITIKRDSWNPHVTITKPAHSERVKSWKTVRGTASDKGSGVHFVLVVPVRQAGNKVYCYTAKKTWLRLTSDADYGRCGVAVRVTKGKWSLALKGLGKGEFAVIAVAADWSDRASNTAQRTKKLTHA